MKERKIVKLRVDMYDDIKFKIIDTKPERDLIHYVWTRLLTLAGKINLEGYLYMSKTLSYTIETLAIEFNRDIEQIKLALGVFIELEMIELSCDNVYRVTNFAKHQNIKVIEKIKSKDEDVKSNGISIEETRKNELYINEDKESENKTSQDEGKAGTIEDKSNLETTSRNKVNNMNKDKTNNIVCFHDYDEKKPVRKGETLIASWVL